MVADLATILSSTDRALVVFLDLTILVPEDTSDEQLEAIGRKFLSSMIITDGAQVKRGTCSMPEDPMPDIAEMLSAYGI